MSPYIVNYKVGERDDQRPWGMWETTAVGHLPQSEGSLAYCDKIITVKPGCELSIQRHEFRKEDWTILQGRSVVYLGESPEALTPHNLTDKDCIHIPAGTWHRIKNIGDTLLTFTERQSGIYLDEDDIIRHPTAKDPRTTNADAMQRITEHVKSLGLSWPNANDNERLQKL